MNLVKLSSISYFFLTSLLFSFGYSFAQNPYHWQLTDDDGLPNLSVNSICQDSLGYIWMATNSGLSRYDGVCIKVFFIKSIYNQEFKQVITAPKGNIYALTKKGELFEEKEEEFLKIETPKDFGKIIAFQITSSGEVWIHNKQQVYLLSTSKEWQKVVEFESKKDEILQIALDKDEKLWLLQKKSGTSKINDSKVTPFACESCITYQKDYSSFRLGFYQDQTMLTTEGRGRLFLLQENQFQKEKLKGFFVQESPNIIYEDSNKNIWIGTKDRLHIYTNDFKKDLIADFVTSFSDKEMTDIFEDREHNIWVGTAQNGIYIFPNVSTTIFDYDNSIIADSRVISIGNNKERKFLVGLGGGDIEFFSVLKDQEVQSEDYLILDNEENIHDIFISPLEDKLWVLTNADLYEFIGYYDYFYEARTYFRQKILPFSNLNSMAYDYQGNVLVSSEDKVSIWNIQGELGKKPPNLAKSWQKFPQKTDEIQFSHFLNTLNLPEDEFDKLYDDDEAYEYLEKLGHKQIYKQKFHEVILREVGANAVWVDSTTQSYWVAFEDELIYYQEGVENIVQYQKKSIRGSCLAQYQNQDIWVGTLFDGLYQIRNHQVIKHLNIEKGLLSNRIITLQAQENKLWIGTDKGIQLLELKENNFHNFTKQDGLNSISITALKVIDGQVWIGTSSGLMNFPETLIKYQNPIPPKLHLLGVSINEGDTTQNLDFDLDYFENDISVFFRAISIRSRGNFYYEYRLLGLDSTWTRLESSANEVRFNSLPYGNFTFQIRAFNEDGVASSFQSIQMAIAKPFWLQWWFFTTIILVIIGVLSSIFLYRLRNERKRSLILQELRGSQLTALKAQMNPHFIFNALNSIQEFILLNEKRLANSYLGKFADLMRLMLDMSNKDWVSLEEELKALQLYLELEALRFEESFSYDVQIMNNIELEEITIPPMIIQPHIENAIKHGLLHKKENRKMWLRIKLLETDSLLYCEVEDNGVGRQKSAQLQLHRPKSHQSFATSATQRRLELLNYTRNKNINVDIIDLESNEKKPLGTKVIMNIPVKI